MAWYYGGDPLDVRQRAIWTVDSTTSTRPLRLSERLTEYDKNDGLASSFLYRIASTAATLKLQLSFTKSYFFGTVKVCSKLSQAP